MAIPHGVQPPWRLSGRGLNVRRGGQPVLRGVSIDYSNGEVLSIIGPNGAGKTTLLLTLLGLMAPESGTLTLSQVESRSGVPLHALSSRVRASLAAYVPQSLDAIPGFTVYETVATGRYPHVSAFRALADDDHAAIQLALDLCGLLPLANRSLQSLSGGERQKALLAAAFAQDAQAVFLDEPTTALDPVYQMELVRLLGEWRARGRGIVIVSHDLNLPLRIDGRVVALRAGEVVDEGAASDVLRPEKLRKVFGAEFEQVLTSTGRPAILPRG